MHNEVVHNPLASLCRQLSLEDRALARLLDCPLTSVQAALNENPREPLRTYLKLALALGVKMRLLADAPLRLWFDLRAIDALHSNEEFRRDCALDPLPVNRGELRRAIRKLHRRGLSHGEIAERFQKSFIPTATGVRTWRRSTIGQHLTLKVSGEDDSMPLGMSDELRLAFRAHAISQLLVAMCPFDPFAAVRYEIQQTERDGLLVLETEAPLPASLRRWIAAAVVELGWFEDSRWGEMSEDAAQRASAQAAPDPALPAEPVAQATVPSVPVMNLGPRIALIEGGRRRETFQPGRVAAP